MGFELLEKITYREPGPEAVDRIKGSASQRIAALSNLIVRDGRCAWCNTEPIPTKRHKYCGRDCQTSAYLFCYPQAPESKAWRLIHRQSCACAGCGESFEDLILERIRRRFELQQARAREWNLPIPTDLAYFQVGEGLGHLLHLDHIVPLFRGGVGIGFENTQVLCVPCHEKKTIAERR
jgi:hypothetical protein